MAKIYRYRKYCKTCGDYVLYKEQEKDLICTKCGTVHEHVELRDIPKEIKEAQRKRYADREFQKLMDVYDIFTNPNHLSLDFMYEVYEDDAGYCRLRKINEKRKNIRKKHFNERLNKHQEFVEKTKTLGRNDKCICGSGKKFKKCCQIKIEQENIELNNLYRELK
jgi:transcription initiation factor TFIIIB Brf1 subunit/transcription initiation factor TFIIB